MKKKSYKLTFALKEGYSPKGKVHSIGDAAKIIKAWMEQKLTAREPVVSGLLQEGQLFFPATDSSKELVTVSPTAVYYGELSTPEELKRKNKEVKETLESLAKQLKTGLKQQSVFVIYRDVHWCV
jgi:GTP cyclohydrolase I